MMTLNEWQQQGKYQTIHSQRIFTRQGGDTDSPVLVLIHGYPSASWDFEGMWNALTERYHVVTLDMLGFGLSDKPKDAPYLISEQADIFESFLRTLNVSDYHILAHDYGDTVAQELLARQVEGSSDMHISSVCFLNGGLFPETHKPILIQKLLLSPLGPLVSKMITKKKFAANLTGIFGPVTPPTPEVIDTLWELLTYGNPPQ